MSAHIAQSEIFDKLYAAEFKRFVTGKIASESPLMTTNIFLD